MEQGTPFQLSFLDEFFSLCTFDEALEGQIFKETIMRIDDSPFDYAHWDYFRKLAPLGSNLIINDFGRKLSLRLLLKGYICIPVVKASNIPFQQRRPVNLWIKPINLWKQNNTKAEIFEKLYAFSQMLFDKLKEHTEKNGGTDV